MNYLGVILTKVRAVGSIPSIRIFFKKIKNITLYLTNIKKYVIIVYVINWFVGVVVITLSCHAREHGFESRTNRN